MSSSSQPRRSSSTRTGTKRKQASASASRPSRRSRASSASLMSMQVQHVGGGIFELRFGKLAGAPVRRLLLLGNLEAEDLARQLLQAVAVGVGAHQPRGDLGAPERRHRDAERMLQHRHVEAGEVKNLGDRRIGQEQTEIGRARLALARCGRHRRCRRRARAAPGRAGRGRASAPSPRCRPPRNRDRRRDRRGRRHGRGCCSVLAPKSTFAEGRSYQPPPAAASGGAREPAQPRPAQRP